MVIVKATSRTESKNTHSEESNVQRLICLDSRQI